MISSPSFQARAAAFIEPLLGELRGLGVGGDLAEVDHVCYRVADLATYERYRLEFSSFADLLSEAFINGRPIASFKLRDPVMLASGARVAVVELPAPKAEAANAEGFEHFEVVTRAPLEEFLAKWPKLDFNTANFHAAANRDLSLRLSGGLVKFHEASLEDVIAEEQRALARRQDRRVAVFDFDDTLVVSRQAFLEAFHRSLVEYLGEALPFAEFRAKARPTFPEFFANFGIMEPKAMEAVLTLFQRHWRAAEVQCSVPVGIVSALSCLRSEGVELHVWTARDLETTVEYLESSRLAPYFASVTAFDARGASKPEPTAALRKIAAGARGVVIGDSDTDMAAATRLGFGFVQATWVRPVKLDVSAETRCGTPLAGLARTLQLLA